MRSADFDPRRSLVGGDGCGCKVEVTGGCGSDSLSAIATVSAAPISADRPWERVQVIGGRRMEMDVGGGGTVGDEERYGDGRGRPSRRRALSLRGRLPATRLMQCPFASTPICSRHTTLSCGENGTLLGTLRDICEKDLPSHRAPRAVWALRDARRAPITCTSSSVAA